MHTKMKMKFVILLFVGVVIQSIFVEGKRRRVHFREVNPTTSDTIIRSQRGVIATGYADKVIEQHTAAIAALDEATKNAEATQLLVNNLQTSIRLQQQLHQAHAQQGQPGGVRLIDQYGNDVGGQPPLSPGGYSSPGYTYPSPPPSAPAQAPSLTQTPPKAQQTATQGYPSQPTYLPPPQTQNAYLPPYQTQTVQHHFTHYQQQQPQPHHHFVQQEVQPIFQQFVTPEGTVFYQQVLPQPAPVHVDIPAVPEPHYHLQQPLLYHHHHDHAHIVSPPAVAALHSPVHYDIPVPLQVAVETPAPVVKKVVKSAVITKEVVPTVKLVKQPILSPAVFQKEIFAVKNPPVRVLTYSDLCTVYPYQRKLAGCVYKKAAIPEFHHPDIQLVPEQTKPSPDKNLHAGEGVLDPRTSSLRIGAVLASKKEEKDDTSLESIQDILSINRHQGLSSEVKNSETKDEEDDVAIVNEDEEANVAESSNKKEKLVINTTKPKGRKSPRTSKVPIPSASKVLPTKVSEAETASSSTTRKPKSKRRSRNSKRTSSARTKKNPNATTEQPFKLA